ncbi:Transmembrane emp24 domain-containing protein 1 [Acipenser ruthenus]|uniref:Transmembrane emp24 domain-containing protein 1 n=2 Tax=Acipenser ruthenus TaxID=7906 RepID=A0A444UV42_ACIRT|nr:Transmembrane emp24 domain-containing protein 1 [Acipenser ruthenus]
MADGDYEICFDNSFSRMSEKMVFFEVITEGLLQDTAVEDWAQVVQPDELVDFKLDDIRDSMDGVRRRLERSMQMQTMLRAFEARDRNLQEDNLFRVTFWSSLNMLVMMVVALVQVYLLRSLFNDKRKVRT